MRTLQQLVRQNIQVYECHDFVRPQRILGDIRVFLDANECPYNSPYNRYPDADQKMLKEALAVAKGVTPQQICVSNGRDEIIDLLFRCFCQSGIDNVVVTNPTYGMYCACAQINAVECRSVMLDDKFNVTAERLLDCCDEHTKIIWLCSPNELTGIMISQEEVELLLDCFDGIVVVDETYVDYSKVHPFRSKIGDYNRLVSIDTLSVAWGCAAANLAMAYSNEEIITVLNKVKFRHNVSTFAQKYAIDVLSDPFEISKQVSVVRLERQRLMDAVAILPCCVKVFDSDANFFLAQMTDADKVYSYLVKKGVLVTNCNGVALCENCLRITVGTKNENNELLAALRQY